jgi:hypothetical protein
MRDRRNGPGSNDAPHSFGNSRWSGKFLAKLVLLMEDVQQACGAEFARE